MALLQIVLYLWQLPQNLLGLLIVAFLKPEATLDFSGAKVYFSTRMRGGISLGRYIVLKAGLGHPHNICHEWGHSRQSLYLGWLYLLIIGLPSLIWAAVYTQDWKVSYYDFYTEKWADKLGGVKR